VLILRHEFIHGLLRAFGEEAVIVHHKWTSVHQTLK
jgi:hypothetical protein